MRILFLLIIGGLLSSCQYDGCTDMTAINYDPNAASDDGSCLYENLNPNGGNTGYCWDGVINQSVSYGNVTDIDGNNYRTVQMGNQNWMAENLRVTHYQNGDPIPNITNGNQWTNLNSGAWVYHRNDSATSHCPEGKLYNHFAIRDSRNICPQGWHVPDELEFRELLQFADPNATFSLIPGAWGNSFSNWRSLASVGTNQNPSFESSVIDLISNDTIWTAVTQMTNTSGLSFVSSGYYYRGPYDEQHTFRTNRYAARFWTSNNTWFIGYGSAGICYTFEGFNPSQFWRGQNRKTDGMACRCVQD